MWLNVLSHIFYALMACVLLILHFLQLLLSKPFDEHDGGHVVPYWSITAPYWCGAVASLTLFIKAIDPTGGYNVVPKAFLILAQDFTTHLIVFAIFATAMKVCSLCHQGDPDTSSKSEVSVGKQNDDSKASDSSEEERLSEPIPRCVLWGLGVVWVFLAGSMATFDICIYFTPDLEWLRGVVLVCSGASFIFIVLIMCWSGRDLHRTFAQVAPDIFEDIIVQTPQRESIGYGSRLVGSQNTTVNAGSNLSSGPLMANVHEEKGSQAWSPLRGEKDELESHVQTLLGLKAKYSRFMTLRNYVGILSAVACIFQMGRGITLLASQKRGALFLQAAGDYDVGDDLLVWLQCFLLFGLVWYAWTPVKNPIPCFFGKDFYWKPVEEDSEDENGEALQTSSFFGSKLSYSSPWPSRNHSRNSEPGERDELTMADVTQQNNQHK